jgi:ABC-2 type transport system ATP-binding protein
MNATRAIEIRDLTVNRGGNAVLRNVSLEIESGKVTGLLGPSGSGKSTLLRSIVGVQTITSGSASVLNLASGTAELRKRVGYVTQSASIYDDLTVHENLGYFGAIFGVLASALEKALADVDLSAKRNQRVRTLSGGERARVSLACALVQDPQVLVLDEPTVGLDPLLRRDLWQLFHRLADAGKTLLVSSHVMDEASRCDTLLLLRDGVLLAHGTLDSLMKESGAKDAEGVFLSLIENRSHEGAT